MERLPQRRRDMRRGVVGVGLTLASFLGPSPAHDPRPARVGINAPDIAPSFNPEENEKLRRKLITEMGGIFRVSSVEAMEQKETELVREHFGHPFALRFVLPSIMHVDLRTKAVKRLEEIRKGVKTERVNDTELAEYKKRHKPLTPAEDRFRKKHQLSYEMFASIKENMPKIRSILRSLDVHEELIPNAAKLAMLNQTETAGGIYLGDGPAHRQWRSDRRQECNVALRKLIADINASSENYGGFVYHPGLVFGSTRPQGAYSGGAIGVQFMPYRLVAAIPEEMRGLNPFDVFFDGQLMISYYLSSRRNIRFVKRVVTDREQEFNPASKDGELEILTILWNNSPDQVKSISDAGRAYAQLAA